mmetsp:Transcript_2146/g.5471  ORF Transcript_2146/g.5471 Transcript_2146/m.5471 type:complete len:283 (+) Transcript_2146:233-1081(+)
MIASSTASATSTSSSKSRRTSSGKCITLNTSSTSTPTRTSTSTTVGVPIPSKLARSSATSTTCVDFTATSPPNSPNSTPSSSRSAIAGRGPPPRWLRHHYHQASHSHPGGRRSRALSFPPNGYIFFDCENATPQRSVVSSERSGLGGDGVDAHQVKAEDRDPEGRRRQVVGGGGLGRGVVDDTTVVPRPEEGPGGRRRRRRRRGGVAPDDSFVVAALTAVVVVEGLGDGRRGKGRGPSSPGADFLFLSFDFLFDGLQENALPPIDVVDVETQDFEATTTMSR